MRFWRDHLQVRIQRGGFDWYSVVGRHRQKNAIMMIDFAIEAEREHGWTSRQAIYEACLLRFRPIMMTTCAALLGGLPLAIVWASDRSSEAVGHYHRRRLDLQPDVDSLHNAGDLHLSTVRRHGYSQASDRLSLLASRLFLNLDRKMLNH